MNIKSLQAQMLDLKTQLDQVMGVVQDIRMLVGSFGVKIDDDQLLVQTIYGMTMY